MSILGFGGGATSSAQNLQKNQPENLGGHQTEELRDEKINQDLQEAFGLKNKGDYQRALELYLMVLSQDFIKNSHLEQHVLMKQNAHKHVGEIYELTSNFKLAKNHYTNALKIKQTDSWVWNKIGMIEYQQFANLDVARQCFEAAINTRATLQKRSAMICPTLVKLAEINFKLSDFQKSEELVDSILTRASRPNIDPHAKLFAMKMKAFFYSLNGDGDQKKDMLAKLEEETGQKGCSYHDLEIIKEFYQKIEFGFKRHGSKGVPVFDKDLDKFIYIKLEDDKDLEIYDQLKQTHQMSIEPGATLEQVTPLQSMFDDFLERLATALDSQPYSLKITLLDTSEYVAVLESLLSQSQGFVEPLMTKVQLKQLDLTLSDQVSALPKQTDNNCTGSGGATPTIGGQQQKTPKGRAGKQMAQSNQPVSSAGNQTRRGLRRKMDFTQQQLSLINLKTLDSYKDYLVNEYQSQLTKRQSGNPNCQMEFVFSQDQLLRCKKLIEDKQLFKTLQNSSEYKANCSEENEENNQEEIPQNFLMEDLQIFHKLLRSINGVCVPTVLRRILKFAFDHHTKFTNFYNSIHLYKLFQILMIVEGPFSQKWIQKHKETWELYIGQGKKNDILNLSGDSINLLLCMFELSLFNKHVMKAVKSGPLMEQRQILFDYFNVNQTYIHSMIDNLQKNEERALQQHIRLIYSMMYCAFEIKNDMMQSVNLYQQLQSFLPILQKNKMQVFLPWVSYDYYLNNQRMAEFGDFKIKQAKIFKDYDSGMLKLKQREHQHKETAYLANKKGQKKQGGSPEVLAVKIDESEFDEYASFYLDQFFLYLNASVSIKKGEDAKQANNSGAQIQNEEKVKEMWSQLTYAICRASPPLLLKAIQSLFCVFTSINYLNKSFYEQFILKKLDFEKIVASLHGRMKLAYDEIVNELKDNSNSCTSIHSLKEATLAAIQKLMGLPSCEEEVIEQHLLRLQITVLRHLTPEYLHYNIFLAQSSNTALQNLMNQSGIHQTQSQAALASAANVNAQQNMSIILCLGQKSVGMANPQIYIIPQILYYLEFFKSIINADPNRDNAFNLRSVTRLFIHIDKLSIQNVEKKEVFVRAYSQLIVHAFPTMLKCLKIDICRAKNDAQSTQVGQSHNLLLFVSQIFKFFFDMKMSLDQIDDKSPAYFDDEEMENDENDQCSDQDEEDMNFRRYPHLSCLLGQLKREKQSKNWNQQYGGQGNKSPMLKFFQNNCQVDVSLLADVIQILNFLTQDRLVKHGHMTFKDIKTIQVFNDLVMEHFLKNLQPIQESVTSSPGNQLIKVFKEINKTDPFSLRFDPPEQFKVAQAVNQTQCSEIKLVLDYIQNMLAHTILQFAPYQISRFDLATRSCGSQNPSSVYQGGQDHNFYFAYTKKGGALGNFPVQIAKIHETILNQMVNMDGNGQASNSANANSETTFQQFRNLKNQALRNLSRIIKLDLLQHSLLQGSDLNQTLFGVSYMQSLIHFQQYATNCGPMLFIQPKDVQQKLSEKDLKKRGLEKEKMQRYLQSSVFSSIIALRCLLQDWKKDQEATNGNRREPGFWDDLSYFEKSKMVLEQMLTIVVTRIKIKKLKHRLRRDANFRNSEDYVLHEQINLKISNLKTVAYLLANICDQIDIYSAPSNDPRINFKLKQNSAHNIVIDILERFLKVVQTQVAANSTIVSKYLLDTSKAEECIVQMNEIANQNNFESRKIQDRLRLNFLYSFVQAKYALDLNQKFGLTLYQSKFIPLRRSLEIALVNKNINGVLESFRRLIKESLDLAIQLKYKKASLTQQVLKEYQNIIQNVVKPILQDQDFKKYIFNDLGQSLLSGIKDTDIHEDQMQQLQSFMSQNGENKAQMSKDQAAIDEDAMAKETNSHKVRLQINVSQVSDDELLSGKSTCMKEENDLNQIYKVADFVNNNLNHPTKQWIKTKYQLMCAQSLLKELKCLEGEGDKTKENHEKVKLVLDMLKPLMNQLILTYEETWNGMIYDDRDKKNIITSINHQELLGLTQQRLKYMKFFVEVCQQALEYEPIKDIYRKKLASLKQIEVAAVVSNVGLNFVSTDNLLSPSFNQALCNGTLLYELYILFDLSKNQYINVLCSSIQQQYQMYTQVRKIVAQNQEKTKGGPENMEPKWKAHHFKQALETFERMRREFQVTKDQVPPQLKEIFDIFVEINQKKGFLVTRKLITEDHRTLVVQSVINCCAICGPDNLNTKKQGGSANQKSHVKFLDLTKLTDQSYQREGLVICVQWYLEVLDRQTQKKNVDFHKKLKLVMDELKARYQTEDFLTNNQYD